MKDHGLYFTFSLKFWTRFIVTVLIFLSGRLVFAQNKGTKPLQPTGMSGEGNTYAVVIGISDYQDPGITDLQYAHKDAEAFADYLRSQAGGGLDEDHIKVYLNENATLAAFASALDWLWNTCQQGDKAIIYFSGHGDVEFKSFNNLGYLLCWDASSRVYMAGGALPLFVLQDVVSRLSSQINAKVIIIADACHSGALAGATIGGPQATAENLSKQFANEIKILSCQPNEFSIEGEQWGGGRGVFSYHLIDALYGLADANQDQWVSLQEVGRYLEDKVSEEVAPLKQIPTIYGERSTSLTLVDSFISNSLRKGHATQMATLAPIASKGLEELVFTNLDSSLIAKYYLFKQSLRRKQFLEPTDSCADYYFNQLLKEEGLIRLHSSMRRNYATALQDDAQQVLNGLLNVDIAEITKSKVAKLKKYKNYPSYLNKAAELLGPSNIMYRILKARQYFFEGLLMWWENSGNKNVEEGNKVMDKYRQSLQFDKEAAHVYFFMMYCQATKFVNKDSTIYYAEEAMKYSPRWVLPYVYLSYYNSQKFKDFVAADNYLKHASAIDSNNVMVLFTRATWHYYKDETIQANDLYQIVASKDPDNAIVRLNLGVVNIKLGNYESAIRFLEEYLRLDSTGYQGYYYLGVANSFQEKDKEAERCFLLSISLNPNFVNSIRELAKLYRRQKQNDKAELYFRKLLDFDFDKKPGVFYELACLSALKNNPDEALKFLEQALKSGYNNFTEINQNIELDGLRRLESFQKLQNEYRLK